MLKVPGNWTQKYNRIIWGLKLNVNLSSLASIRIPNMWSWKVELEGRVMDERTITQRSAQSLSRNILCVKRQDFPLRHFGCEYILTRIMEND